MGDHDSYKNNKGPPQIMVQTGPLVDLFLALGGLISDRALAINFQFFLQVTFKRGVGFLFGTCFF